jgi:hypothetical protein
MHSRADVTSNRVNFTPNKKRPPAPLSSDSKVKSAGAVHTVGGGTGRMTAHSALKWYTGAFTPAVRRLRGL